MKRLSDILYLVTGEPAHWCPGCNRMHQIPVHATVGPRWTWNGSASNPTFEPSVRISSSRPRRPNDPDSPMENFVLCHYFIRNGNIEYCGDSAHALAGTTVPMPIIPLEAA